LKTTISGKGMLLAKGGKIFIGRNVDLPAHQKLFKQRNIRLPAMRDVGKFETGKVRWKKSAR
jgi:hypothetical protein